MALHIENGMTLSTQQEKRKKVLSALAEMQTWPYWEEIYLNSVKESPLSYEAFAAAVQTGDASPKAFDDAVRQSQMTREEFDTYLPEFQKFMALCTEYAPGMLSDGVDRIWHAFMLISRRYREFCERFFGFPIDHLPCSLYPLYGVDVTQSSCVNKCVPSSCKGNGGGCGSEAPNVEITKEGILAGTQTFVDVYTEVFGSPPDVLIWNQLADW